jgi:transglutaminase-like putative cysteine protease
MRAMRFSPHDVATSRVRLRYSVELHYDVLGPSEFLMNVHAANNGCQTVDEEIFSTDPHREVRLDVDPSTGNRIAGFEAFAGDLTVRYAAVVDIAHRMVDPQDISAETPVALPAETLRFLYPSRYCQADLVQQRAWDQFGQMPRGYAQILAIRDWVETNLEFRIGVSHAKTSVVDTLEHAAGVCRDFAHVMISFCRALNYPARFVTGVDYGADPGLGPPDFHAYVEVFVGGAWYLFDPTGISPTTGLIRIGTGRDAADVSFATIFGPVRTGMPLVQFSAVDDPGSGFAEPQRTTLAVSTAC